MVIGVVVGFVLVFGCIYFSWRWIGRQRGNSHFIINYINLQLNFIELCHESGKNETIQLGVVDHSNLEDELGEGEGNLEELPLFKLEMLANATNSFSEANKLGRGGFGPVYKVICLSCFFLYIKGKYHNL